MIVVEFSCPSGAPPHSIDPKLPAYVTYLHLISSLSFDTVVQEAVIIGDHITYFWSKAN